MISIGDARLALSQYNGKRVFVTGHTGFKGSWMMAWLEKLGADVTGYSLPLESATESVSAASPVHFSLLQEKAKLKSRSIAGDIRNSKELEAAMQAAKPEIVFHMAAQAIVRKSYRDPVETFDTNVMGTLKVFEAARKTPGVRAIINVTSDKCYENKEWAYGYRENDPMGGYDPYSASKGCAELVTSSYQRSYFPLDAYKKSHNVLLTSVRAGNVIGGGDWAEDRLIPDLVRGTVATNAARRTTEVRNPTAIRPWQHVLEPLCGYLTLGARLLNGDTSVAESFNFGPDAEGCVPVGELLKAVQGDWSDVKFEFGAPNNSGPHEAHFLRLDSGKARAKLAWQPRLNFKQTIGWTTEWYKEFYKSGQLLTHKQIDRYSELL